MITVERADHTDEAGVLALIDFMLPMAEEVAVSGFDREAAIIAFYRMVEQGLTHFAKVDYGLIAGCVAMGRVPYWYNPTDHYLQDGCLYISPSHDYSLILHKLLLAVRADAERLGKPAFIQRANVHRPPDERRIDPIFVSAWFKPFGVLIPVFDPHRRKR